MRGSSGRNHMIFKRLTSKPRGLLRDATIVACLLFFDPSFRFMVAGAGILLVGLALHFWSKGCLVRNHTVTVCGPYRLVRHPFYLANFIIDAGICVISGNLWFLGVYFMAFVLVYVPTIRKEEQLLNTSHGDTYPSFARKIPALIPYRLHAIFGPLDFKWANVIREREVSRVLRILAMPCYFVIVGTLFHETPRDETLRIVALCGFAALALLLNVGGGMMLQYERRQRGVLRPSHERRVMDGAV